MNIRKHSITSWIVRSFFPGCHLHKLEHNESTGLHRGYKLFQIEQANMLHLCSTALLKIIKRSDRRGRKPMSWWFSCALLRQHLTFITSQPTWLCWWLWYEHLKLIPKEFSGVGAIPSSPRKFCRSLRNLPPMMTCLLIPASGTTPTPTPPSHCLHERMLLNQHQSVSTFCHMGLMLKARDWSRAGCSSGYKPDCHLGVSEAQQEPVATAAQQNCHRRSISNTKQLSSSADDTNVCSLQMGKI